MISRVRRNGVSRSRPEGGGARQKGARQPTIQELVNQDEIVLDGLLVELAKVATAELDQAIKELEDERSVRVALGDGDNVDVLVLDMAERGAAEGEDGRADLGVADDLDAEDIGEARAAVVAKRAEDKVLALLVEDEYPGQHLLVRVLVSQWRNGESEVARPRQITARGCACQSPKWQKPPGTRDWVPVGLWAVRGPTR